MSDRARSIQRLIVDIHHSLYDFGFSVGNDGNTSYRHNHSSMWITPAGLNKAKLLPRQIGLIDLNSGKTLLGKQKPSTEWLLHSEIYKSNPKVKAIVHAHPPFSIACSLVKISLENMVLPELAISMGPVPTLTYLCPGTLDLAKQVAKGIRGKKGLIMQRHGVVTVGDTLEEALIRMEIIEHAAKIFLLAKSAGNFTALTKKEQAVLNRQIKTVYEKN